MARRPSKKTVAAVVAWLESIGLSIYGDLTNLDTGERFSALMDYDIEEIEKLAVHIKNGTLCELAPSESLSPTGRSLAEPTIQNCGAVPTRKVSGATISDIPGDP